MEEKIVALISIGQSPRRDLTDDFENTCGTGFRFLDIGALDNLSMDQIAGLAPKAGEPGLITKLSNGRVIYVAHAKIQHYIEKALHKAVENGAKQAVIACTGEFSCQHPQLSVIIPNQVLASEVGGILKQGDKLAILVPMPGQVGEATRRWEKRGFSVSKTLVGNPFDNQQGLLEAICRDPVIQSTQALIADCFGFTIAFFNQAVQVYDKPVFLSRKLIGSRLLSGS